MKFFYFLCALLGGIPLTAQPKLYVVPLNEETLSSEERSLIAPDPGFRKWTIVPEGFDPYKPIIREFRKPFREYLQGKESLFRLPSIYLDDQGHAFIWGSDQLASLSFSSISYLPGERIQMCFTQGNKRAERPIYPYPLMDVDENGNPFVWAELLTPSLYKISAPYIPQNEPYELVSISGDEVLRKCTSGPLTMTLAPAVIGKGGGYATLELIFKNKTYHLQLPWGAALMPYLSGSVPNAITQ